jgi:RNA polymerase sigma-70 factor (ECF subfamily)
MACSFKDDAIFRPDVPCDDQRSATLLRFILQRMQSAQLMLDLTRPLSGTFDEVVRQRENQVLRTAYRILGNWADAEEVAQETFLRLHRHGMGFASDASLGAWIYRVTVNLCVDRTRRAKSAPIDPDYRDKAATPEAGAIREQQKQQLMNALETLPVKERAAIVLREIEGLSTAEVAAILGSREVTVRSQISKALTRLRARLEQL